MSETHNGVSVVIPCYNEAQSIAAVLDQVYQTLDQSGRPFEIIVVDDGSTDQTSARVDTSRFRLIRREVNRGYGSAIKMGVEEAQYKLIAITDADGTYPNEMLPSLIDETDHVEVFDMVVGSRTGKRVKVPLVRRPAKWLLTRLANYISGHRIPDLNSGLRVFHRSLWNKYERYFPEGFSLTTTITLAALTNGHRVKFVPIDYHPRSGKSKIRPIRDTINFFILILRTMLYFDPLKVFVPISLLLFLIGGVVGIGTLVLSNVYGIGQFMDVTTVLLLLTSIQLLALGVVADLITKKSS